MSTNFATKLLNQLMGPNRNVLPKSDKYGRHWSDKDVCKNFLAGVCPRLLFLTTKSDLGECHLNHADILKEDYEKSEEFGTKGYELDLADDIKRILNDCDRKIERAKEKIIANKAKSKEALEKAEIERQSFLDTKIEHLLAKIEALGSQGRVEEAQEVADVIEKLKHDKTKPIDAPSAPISNYLLEKDMEVCNTCGAFILIGDLQTRFEDHVIGKQHAGYQKLRDTLEALKNTDWDKKYRMAKKSSRDREKSKSRSSRHKSSEDRETSRNADSKSSRRDRDTDKRSSRKDDDDRKSSRKDRDIDADDKKSSRKDRDVEADDDRKSSRKDRVDSSRRSSKRERSRDENGKSTSRRDRGDDHTKETDEERRSRKRRESKARGSESLEKTSSRGDSKRNRSGSPTDPSSKNTEKSKKPSNHVKGADLPKDEGELSDDD